MASSLAPTLLVHPAATDRSRNGGETSNSCFTVPRTWSASYARMENVRHFSSLRSITDTSSPLSNWASKVTHHFCGRACVTDSPSPINLRRQSLDHCSGAKTKLSLFASVQDTLNRVQRGHFNPKRENRDDRTEKSHEKQITPTWANVSPWKVFIRNAGYVVLASIIMCTCLPRAAHAVAENSIGASRLGLRVADFLRRSGLPDELVIVIVGMLPVLELRGAIPIGYWLKMDPVKGYILSVVGNMIPVPFIVLYLEKILQTVGDSGETGLKFVRWVVDRTRKKAAPIEEFEWLGLCLFVAVPLPGTGAWTGAIAASILGMPFWDAVTANLFGVVLAGLLVTLLVRVGTKEAVLVGIAMIICSCFVWSLLRLFQRKKGTSST